MPDNDYTKLRVTVDGGVARGTLDNPPVNMLDKTLINELHAFVGAVREDEEVRVVVVESANPDFFLAHVDLGFMFQPETFMELSNPDAGTGDESLINPMQKLMLRIRMLPQVTIAKLAGRLRGGGNEFATAFDMRFAASGRTWLAQPETRMGIIPGGGATQLLPPLVGRARALEVILGGNLFDAETAERYGWVNRALPADELDGHTLAAWAAGFGVTSGRHDERDATSSTTACRPAAPRGHASHARSASALECFNAVFTTAAPPWTASFTKLASSGARTAPPALHVRRRSGKRRRLP